MACWARACPPVGPRRSPSLHLQGPWAVRYVRQKLEEELRRFPKISFINSYGLNKCCPHARLHSVQKTGPIPSPQTSTMSSLSCFPAMRKFLGDSSILYLSISRFKVQGLPRVAGARGLSQLALCCTKLATPRLPDLQPKPVTLRARERARTGIAFSDSETDPKGHPPPLFCP